MEVTNYYPNVTKALNRIDTVMTKLCTIGTLEDFDFNEQLIIQYPEAYLSAAFKADCNEDTIKKLVKCLEGAL